MAEESIHQFSDTLHLHLKTHQLPTWVGYLCSINLQLQQRRILAGLRAQDSLGGDGNAAGEPSTVPALLVRESVVGPVTVAAKGRTGTDYAASVSLSVSWDSVLKRMAQLR